jgi:HK97 family phage prohead protease
MARRALGYDVLDFKFELKELNDAGEIDGYAAVFGNEDLGGDVIEPGAFTKTIQESAGKVPILWQHDRYEPIGLSSQLDQDRKGFHVKGQLNMDVQRAREARSLLNQGALGGLSIGYHAVKTSMVGGVRHLKELAVKEFSPVVFPMNPLATASVKAVGDIIWEPESGYQDLLSDLVAALNPGAPPNKYWVCDVSLDGTHAIVQDYDADQAWVVPISLDAENGPTIAPQTEWVAADQAWVAEPEKMLLASLFTKAAGGSRSFPLSSRGVSWDAAAANKRWQAYCSDGDGKIDFGKYAAGFFWHDSAKADELGSYKLQFVDVADGKPVAVWAGVTACAVVMQGGRGGVDIPDGDRDGVKAGIAAYYAKAAKQYDDDSIQTPWASGKSSSINDFDSFMQLVTEVKEGRMFSGANVASLTELRDRIEALLKLAEPAPATPTDDWEAAKQALEPALATLRDLTTSLKENR